MFFLILYYLFRIKNIIEIQLNILWKFYWLVLNPYSYLLQGIIGFYSYYLVQSFLKYGKDISTLLQTRVEKPFPLSLNQLQKKKTHLFHQKNKNQSRNKIRDQNFMKITNPNQKIKPQNIHLLILFRRNKTKNRKTLDSKFQKNQN